MMSSLKSFNKWLSSILETQVPDADEGAPGLKCLFFLEADLEYFLQICPISAHVDCVMPPPPIRSKELVHSSLIPLKNINLRKSSFRVLCLDFLILNRNLSK